MATSTEIVRNLYDQLAAQNFEGVLSNFAEDCEINFLGQSAFIPFAGTYRGPDGMRRVLETIMSTADLIELEPDEFHEDDDFVTVCGHERGRCKATGREWTSPLTEMFVVKSGKIQKFTCMYDTAAVAQAYASS